MADLLREGGFLNVLKVEADGTIKAPSLDKMRATDLGQGYRGQKKEVVISDVVSVGVASDGVRLFHWDGFATDLDPGTFEMRNQSFAK